MTTPAHRRRAVPRDRGRTYDDACASAPPFSRVTLVGGGGGGGD